MHCGTLQAIACTAAFSWLYSNGVVEDSRNVAQ